MVICFVDLPINSIWWFYSSLFVCLPEGNHWTYPIFRHWKQSPTCHKARCTQAALPNSMPNLLVAQRARKSRLPFWGLGQPRIQWCGKPPEPSWTSRFLGLSCMCSEYVWKNSAAFNLALASDHWKTHTCTTRSQPGKHCPKPASRNPSTEPATADLKEHGKTLQNRWPFQYPHPHCELFLRDKCWLFLCQKNIIIKDWIPPLQLYSCSQNWQTCPKNWSPLIIQLYTVII